MRLLFYPTTFQADIRAFALHAGARPDVETLVVEREDPRRATIARAFRADAVVIDNHVPSFAAAPRALVLWHGYGWRHDDLAQMRRELTRRWGDPSRPNPAILWAAFGERDRAHRIERSRLHPDNVAALGSPYSDLLLPGSPFQRVFSKEAAAPRYRIDVARRRTVLFAPTWHHGSAFGRLGDDEQLLDRLLDALERRGCDAIVRMHDRRRHPPAQLAAIERAVARHGNAELKLKDEHPDTLFDLSVADVLVSNYSSILNHFYFLGRPTIHLDPALAGGDYARFTWRRGRLRAERGIAGDAIWKLPPEEVGGLRAGSFEELLAALDRALAEPGCCRALAAAFVARHYAATDGERCAAVLDAARRRWGLA